ncbi:mucin-3A-like [Argiope bruennichi]|uniref:mucin-3A-like n=1 Tax=Argiope bruennichi TaxID=94029 RepID=UPI00249440B1|nr:mucin-3A-like [Argiope bruennichi]
MEMAAALHGQVHMLMLCVCGTVIMLAAHTTQGISVLKRSAQTPPWAIKPALYTYIPKRFLRIWAEKQDELMMEGPSGDGPLDAWDSPLLQAETSKTSDDYATRSPLPEDILSSQSEPFPSIIDTEIESSETFIEEFIRRSSVLFHGPSSLLNTLVFRPSIPKEPLPSIIPTPTMSSSNFAQTSLYDLRASWTEIEEVASFFKISSRRALSYSPSEMFGIITAISATYIYQEDSNALTISPSIVVSGYPFNSLPSNEASRLSESKFNQRNVTYHFNTSVHLQNSEASYFNISFKTPNSTESYHSVSKINPSFSTDLFSLGVSEAFTDSRFNLSFSKKFSIIEHSQTQGTSLLHFTNSLYQLTDTALINPAASTLWNYHRTSLTVHTSKLSTEAYYFSNNTVGSSFIESLLLQQSTGVIPLITPQRTFFMSNVETTVTIIDNKDAPFTYLLPTLTVTGTTFSGTYEILTSFLEDFSFIHSLESDMEGAIFNDFSTFKHVSLNFDTFSTTESIQGLKSPFSHISIGNIISVSSSVLENQMDVLQSKSVNQFPFSPTFIYPYFSMTDLVSDGMKEAGITSEMPFKSYSVSEMTSLSPLSVFSEIVFNKTEYFNEPSKTLINVAKSDMKNADISSVDETESYPIVTLNISFQYSPSPTFSNILLTSVFEHNATLFQINKQPASLSSSFHTEKQIDSTWKSTAVLRNEITEQRDRFKSEKTPFEHSKELQLFSSTIKDEITSDSVDNFLDTFTHHITVRSLRNTFSFDILTRDISISNGARSGDTHVIERSFNPISTTRYVSNVQIAEIAPTSSSLFLLPKEIIASTPLYSKHLLNDESTTKSKISEIYILESSFIPFKTFSENLFQSQYTEHFTEHYFSSNSHITILPYNQSGFMEIHTVENSTLPVIFKEINASETFSDPMKSIETSINVHPLDSWFSEDFEVKKSFKPSILPSESSSEPMEIITSMLFTYSQWTSVIPISVYEEYSIQLDNHSLESSNEPSETLGSTISLINKDESREIVLKSESEESRMLMSSERVLNKFVSEIHLSPTLPLSSIGPETLSSNADSAFNHEEPKRSYFEFHESTRILESEITLLTPGLFYSSDYVRSAIYDSSEASSDNFNDSTKLMLDFYQSSLQGNLFSSLQPEFSFVSSPSEKASFGSFTVSEYSEKSKVKESAIEISNDRPLSSKVVSFTRIQQTKSIPQVEQVSSAVENSFSEMSVLDLRELSFLSKESSPLWSQDLLTTVKHSRSMSSLLSNHVTGSSFSAHLTSGELLTNDFHQTNLVLSSVKELESIKSETSRELSGLIFTPSTYVPSFLSMVPPSSITSYKQPVSIHSNNHEVPSHHFPSFSSAYSYTLERNAWKSLIYASNKEPSIMESYFPLSRAIPIFSSRLSSTQAASISASSIQPTSVESYFPESLLSPTMSTILSSELYPPASSKTIELLSIGSYHPIPMVSPSFWTSSLPSYVTPLLTQTLSKTLSSARVKDPVNKDSNEFELHFPLTLVTPIVTHSDNYDISALYSKKEPKNIDSVPPQSRNFFIRTVSRILNPSDLKFLSTPSYRKIQSIQSTEFQRNKMSSFFRSLLVPQASFWSMKPQFDVIPSTTLHRLQSTISRVKPTSGIELSPVILRTEVSSTWLGDFSTVSDSSNVILVPVLPISSFLNVNETKNESGTSNRSHPNKSHSNGESEAVPTRNTFLFKDNHYWILTVLEAPAKGQMPENFSHVMENRLANAYSEAFRSWLPKKEGAKEAKDIIVVKILSVTDDILLRQLDIVYVVEKGGSLVPAAVAAEYLNSLRFEQLREFLGYHAIEKARPYRPPGNDVSRPVGSPLPVLAIVGGVLLALLFIFCGVCLYCRCCRPKPAPSTPGSSASGSLQRSLSKYGQHNRKHLFREMTHQLTAEMAAQIKHGSTAPDAYFPEKSTLSGRSLPALPRESEDSEKKADTSMKMLKILENKEASTSPLPGKQFGGPNGALQSSDTSSSEKKKPPAKPKKRRKVKDSGDQASRNAVTDSVEPAKESKLESPPPTPPPKRDMSIPFADHSPDAGASSRHPSTQPNSSSEKEAESEGSHAELLPPIQDLIERSKTESEAAAAEAQMHLSRVRQRISELLDDAFALAGGRRLYGSLRSKKIEPATEVLPRFGSFRSRSATGGELTTVKRQGNITEQRPISEGGQKLLGVLTDEGQLITHPPPKLVWERDERYSLQNIERPLGNEMVEARNRNINLFPFQPQRIQQLPALPSSSSLPLLDTLLESGQDAAGITPTRVLREAASELYLPFSAKMNSATGDQYDELDVVNALRNGEPVEALIQAIKDELQRFAGSLPGTEDGESNA